ncbi:SDR family NAD(P)-dependent oxidoreductase [Amnibacterium flavum]|uniref:SDR family NAD(P)-dependent oxidoreductase n=1 Tax=Amnibacterium flavum TaxID=2173173 RepID=UPI001F0CCF6B|nr:SDR family oxidoreductase [Amnibacterium flavum]
MSETSGSEISEISESPKSRYASYPSLEGRVAFVSGGASGLGAEFVSQLAAQGVRVAFVDIDDAAGEALAREIADRGHPAPWYRHGDVRDIPALQQLIADAGRELGPITVLVNNAANDTRHKVEDVDVALWDDRTAVNIRHHFFAAQAVAPMMREVGGGSIINLGSISAHIDLADLPIYIASKAGIEGLTRTMARELGGDLIRVNCIIPGWVMTQRQLDNWITPEAEASIEANQALPHKLYPDDVARMVLWLAADDSRSCTGQKWIVDGGWM